MEKVLDGLCSVVTIAPAACNYRFFRTALAVDADAKAIDSGRSGYTEVDVNLYALMARG